MRPMEDFFPEVLRYAPAAPDPLIENALREAASTFCERTRCWRDVHSVDVVGDESEIVCVPADSVMLEIEEAWFDDKRLKRMAFTDFDALDWPEKMHGEEPSQEGQPYAISQSAPNSVVLIPRGAGRLKLSLFLKPAPRARTLPNILFDQFLTVIADGATARLLTLPEEPFANLQLASVLGGNFEGACNTNFRFNKRGQQRSYARARSSYF